MGGGLCFFGVQDPSVVPVQGYPGSFEIGVCPVSLYARSRLVVPDATVFFFVMVPVFWFILNFACPTFRRMAFVETLTKKLKIHRIRSKFYAINFFVSRRSHAPTFFKGPLIYYLWYLLAWCAG